MTPAPEIPALLRAVDREDALGRILEAKTPWAALLCPAGAPRWAPAERLQRYRRLVGQVHPDRCADPRAAAALEQASLAFDALAAADALGASGEEACELWLTELATARPPIGSRWWHSSAAAELDRLLDFRASASTALHAALAPRLAGAVARLQKCVVDAERTCEHLDRSRGFERHRLWPRRKRPLPPEAAGDELSGAGAEGKAAAQAQRSAFRFIDLLTHLRAVHRFCLLRGRAYDHQAELAAASPGGAAAGLLGELLAEEATPPVEAAAQGGVDPLDAYMALVEAELQELPQAAAAPEAPSKPEVEELPPAGEPSAAPHAPSGAAAGDARLAIDATGEALGGSAATVGAAVAGAAAAAILAGAGPASSAAPPCAARRPAAVVPGGAMRLATGGLVLLPVAGEAAGVGGDGKGEERSLQDTLLGGLESDESELEDDGKA